MNSTSPFLFLCRDQDTHGPSLKEPQQMMLKSCQGLKYVYKFSLLNRWTQRNLKTIKRCM